MRMTQLFGRTLREAPADVDNTSYRLLARAGLIKKLGAGIFSYGPLFWRVMRKTEIIIRQEMDAIGGQEINMPVVQPAELWNETGRYVSIGSELVRFRDRAGRNMVLANSKPSLPLVASPEPTMHHAPCTMHHALCTMYHVPCTMYHVPCTMHHAPCTMHHALCTMHYVPCTMYLSSTFIKRSVFTCQMNAN